jgi:hypothetical protein
LTEFGYEEYTSSGPAITVVDRVESLKYNYSYNCESSVLTLSKQIVVSQRNNEENTSKKNKSHKGENTQQSL